MTRSSFSSSSETGTSTPAWYLPEPSSSSLEPGLIYTPSAGEYAQTPTVLVGTDHWRVYYANRTSGNKSYISLIDVEPGNPTKILYRHKKPVLEPSKVCRGPWGTTSGGPGSFDEDGVMPSCALWVGEEVWLYYTGWSRRLHVPYQNASGLAISKDGGLTFQRYGLGPVLDRNAHDPFMTITPFVRLPERSAKAAKDPWHMWYASVYAWENIDKGWEPAYAVRHATSRDGLTWTPDPVTKDAPYWSIPPEKAEAIASPCVLKVGDMWHMTYSSRLVEDYRDGKNAYRLGWATSPDGITWTRCNHLKAPAVLPAPAALADGAQWPSWANTMQAYPRLVVHEGKLYLFFNGNGFGQTGFGVMMTHLASEGGS